jgi:hypothetical protein
MLALTINQRRTHDEAKHPEAAGSQPPKPVVFAFASNDAEKKGLKFYKTWKNLVSFIHCLLASHLTSLVTEGHCPQH